jgi:hypothetical protein
MASFVFQFGEFGLELFVHRQVHVAIKLNEVGEQHKRPFQPLNGERKLLHSFRHRRYTSQQSLRLHRTIRTSR